MGGGPINKYTNEARGVLQARGGHQGGITPDVTSSMPGSHQKSQTTYFTKAAGRRKGTIYITTARALLSLFLANVLAKAMQLYARQTRPVWCVYPLRCVCL